MNPFENVYLKNISTESSVLKTAEGHDPEFLTWVMIPHHM
jgi:hypothetical protein